MIRVAKVNENLRRFRRDIGMTQEQVAQKLNVTRQTVSGYESGRTQPDIDMLQKLADVYEVELVEIIYGRREKNKLLRVQKTVAVATLASALTLILVEAFMRWCASAFMAQDWKIWPDRETVWWLSSACGVIGGVNVALFAAGSIAFLALDLRIKERILPSEKILWAVGMLAGERLIVTPLALTDRLMLTGGAVDLSLYAAVPVRICIILLVTLICSFVIDAVRLRRK